jgi:hypothetical protein
MSVPPLTISTTALPPVGVGLPYAYTLKAAGGSEVEFSAAGLPPGIALSSGGTLSGTVIEAGNWQIDITASDHEGPEGGSRTCSTTLTLHAALPEFTPTSGDEQFVPVGATKELSVRVTVAGVPQPWIMINLGSVLVMTDIQGMASTNVTAPLQPGEFHVQAGFDGANFAEISLYAYDMPPGPNPVPIDPLPGPPESPPIITVEDDEIIVESRWVSVSKGTLEASYSSGQAIGRINGQWQVYQEDGSGYADISRDKGRWKTSNGQTGEGDEPPPLDSLPWGPGLAEGFDQQFPDTENGSVTLDVEDTGNTGGGSPWPEWTNNPGVFKYFGSWNGKSVGRTKHITAEVRIRRKEGGSGNAVTKTFLHTVDDADENGEKTNVSTAVENPTLNTSQNEVVVAQLSPSAEGYKPRTARLLPMELRDIKDHANTGDDVTITNWDTAQQITDNNIAWIEAHSSASDAAPRMPQLELRIPGLGQGMTIEAKIEVRYERGNGARHPSRTDKDGNTDTVKIPSDNSFKQVAGDTWQIWSEYPLQDEGFFGGDATLTYRLMNGQSQAMAPRTVRFRIGGKNPDPARAREFIESLNNAGPQGTLWFAYAIAKTESKGYNGGGTRYNQFWQLPKDANDKDYRASRQTHAGRPIWNNDGNNDEGVPLPGGYGLIQVTGNASDAEANIPREQIWNWQKNSNAGLAILESKRTTADAWIIEQKSANNANGVALPNLTVGGVTFAEETDRTMNDAVTMKSYNGSSRANFNWQDNENIAGFVLDPHSAGQFCYWRSRRRVQTDPNDNRWDHGSIQNVPNPGWALSRLNSRNPAFNYVERVCQEVE